MENTEYYKEPKKVSRSIGSFVAKNAMIIILVVCLILFGILTKGNSLQPRNISNILRQLPITAVICIGMAFCIITGNFDLSVGSVAGFIGAVCALGITKLGLNPILCMILSLGVGCIIGLLQGFLVAYQKIPSFIVTLGGLMAFNGAMLILTDNSSITVMDDVFMYVGNEYIPLIAGDILGALIIIIFAAATLSKRRSRRNNMLQPEKLWISIAKIVLMAVIVAGLIYILNMFKGISVSMLILMIFACAMSIVLTYTSFGRKIYAVGGNAMAAKLSGINVEKTTLIAFIISGFFAAMSGLLLSSRSGAAASTGGDGFEMDAIAACVIGGVSLVGGKGKIIGALIGAVLMAVLTNGMSLLGLELHMQNIAKGLVVLAAVWFDIGFSSKRN